MKKQLLALAFVLPGITLYAQRHATEVTLNQHDTLNDKVSGNTQFAFENFMDGVVIYKDGNAGGKLNYNYVSEEMQFVNPKTNQVQALAHVGNILLVYIDKRRFVPTGDHNQFAELLSPGTSGLAVSRKVKAVVIGKEGAYGIISPTSSISTMDSKVGGGESTVRLNTSQTARVEYDNRFYWQNDGKLQPIKNRRSLDKIFGQEKGAQIDTYIQEQHLDIHDEADLLKLSGFCLQLE